MNSRGDFMLTFTGRQFWPLSPLPEDVDIEDIAHGLSMQCRFNGHVREFYSVAEHSVRVSQICDPQDALWGLLHDASEAYLGDVIRPIKSHSTMRPYCQAEEVLMAVICERFGLPHEMPASVALADETMLETEGRNFMADWGKHVFIGVRGLGHRIAPWDPEFAKQMFLLRYSQLTAASKRLAEVGSQ